MDNDIPDRLLPRPHTLTRLPDDYIIDNSCSLICRGPASCPAGERLAGLLGEEWGIHPPLINEKTDGGYLLHLAGNQNGMLRHSPQTVDYSALGDEEYSLQVTKDGAVIEARTERALLWGAMTLRQLIVARDGALHVAGVGIHDRPRYALRGFMIDSGRAPNSLPKLKRIIRICSAFKLNALFFREGDDEMNALRYAGNQLGASNPHAFSMHELRELSAYARQHGMDLIPEVESLGHSAAKGIHYPELVSGGYEHKYAGIGTHIRKAHLAPCDPGTFQLLESIYDELFATLRQPCIHLGLDEVLLPQAIQAAHLEALLPLVFRCARRYGIQAAPIVWADAPATPMEYQDSVYRCLWSYANGGPISSNNARLARLGLAELSRSDCRQPVIMAGGSASGHTPYSKSPHADACRNLAEWSLWGAALENHAGLLAVQWSGNMLDEWLPDFLAAADFGWTPPRHVPEYAGQQRRIGQHLARLADASSPAAEEIDPPAWDGIWLKGNQWDAEILEKRRQSSWETS